MKPAMPDRSMGDGVYYAKGDYVGFWPRVAILIVDSLVLFVGLVLMSIAQQILVPRFPAVFLMAAAVFVWGYEVPLKRSRFRTLGYLLTGAKIVNLQGQPPSLFLLTFRAAMWMLGPFNFLFDLMWSGIDDDRQSLRDRFASTCVVRVNAQPIGSGHVQLTRFFAGGFALMYPIVVHPKDSSTPQAT
jgi:uncharacterized RDD family membrane protein YckC